MATAVLNPRRPSRGSVPLRGLVPLVLGLAIWELVGSPESPYFPVPSQWWAGVKELHQDERLLLPVSVTVTAFASTLMLSIVVGSVVGAIIGRSITLDRMVGPLLEFGRTMPAGALVPVAVLVMGQTTAMKLSVAVLTSMWPVLLNVRAGAMQISAEKTDLARVFGLSRLATFRKVTLPSLVPNVLLGAQIAAPVALILVLLVEILTQVSGVGREIALAQSTFKSATVYGLVILAGLLGLLVNWLIGWLELLIRRFDASDE